MKYELKFYQRLSENGTFHTVCFYFDSLIEAAQAAGSMEKHFPTIGYTDFEIKPVKYEGM